MAESTVLIKIVTRGERKAEKLRETLDRTKTVTRQLDGQLRRTFGGTATKQLDRATKGLDKFEKEAKTANRTLQALAATAAGLSALNIGLRGTVFAGLCQALKLVLGSSKRLVAEQKKASPSKTSWRSSKRSFRATLRGLLNLRGSVRLLLARPAKTSSSRLKALQKQRPKSVILIRSSKSSKLPTVG